MFHTLNFFFAISKYSFTNFKATLLFLSEIKFPDFHNPRKNAKKMVSRKFCVISGRKLYKQMFRISAQHIQLSCKVYDIPRILTVYAQKPLFQENMTYKIYKKRKYDCSLGC